MGYTENMVAEVRTLAMWRDVGAEFFATFFLVAVQCGLLVDWHHKADGNAIQNGLGMGFVVCYLAWTLGDFGGGHMNPAVTIAMMACAKTYFIRGIFYIIVQIVAGILGAAFTYGMTPSELREGLGVTAPGEGVASWQAMLVEVWITCMLVITVLGSTNARRKDGKLFMATIPIGFAVGLGLLVGYGYSGGSMNPARSIGPAVVTNSWRDHWVYWVGPIVGGLLAVLVYHVMLDRVDRKDTTNEEQPMEQFPKVTQPRMITQQQNPQYTTYQQPRVFVDNTPVQANVFPVTNGFNSNPTSNAYIMNGNVLRM